MKNFFRMSTSTPKDPIVDDELLQDANAIQDGQQLGDQIEDEIADHQEAPAEADNDNAAIAEFERQLTEKDERYLRLYAEFENAKKRNAREKRALMDTAGANTMKALLPVLDDFDRAAKQAESEEETKAIWDSGVGLIVSKLFKTLEGQGLKPMVSTGEDFNADLHEAITEIPNPDMAGKNVDTVERGYTLNGKIIRFAKVVVGK